MLEYFLEDEANNYDEIEDHINDLYNDYVVLNVNIIIESVAMSDDSKNAMVRFLWSGLLEPADEEGDGLINVSGATAIHMVLDDYEDKWKIIALSGDLILGVI